MKNLFFSGPRLIEVYDQKKNNFHLVRFVLAMTVIYTHSIVLLGNKGDHLAELSNYQIDAGRLAVYCFFIVSGFLVTQSALHSESTIEFVAKRILRIVPAFLVSLLLVAFVIGPIVTPLSLSEYFRPDPQGDPYRFVQRNITFGLTGGFLWEYKDVFSGNPRPNAVNGSMWTLSHEVACYAIIAILLFMGLLRKRYFMVALLGIAACAIFAYFELGFAPIKEKIVWWWVLNPWNYDRFIRLVFFFISGSLMYLFKEKVPYNKKLFIISIAGIVVAMIFGKIHLGLYLFLPYAVIYCCIGAKYASFQQYGDYSYGLYIFSFPIQQTILHYKADWTIPQFLILSSVASLIVAFFSWHVIEKPALGLKKMFRAQKEKIVVPSNVKT